jgi:hypothetical protein
MFRGVPGLEPFREDTAVHHCWKDTGSMARGEGTMGLIAAPMGVTAKGRTSCAAAALFPTFVPVIWFIMVILGRSPSLSLYIYFYFYSI